MDRHRTRFLASLSARLERDRALRESESDTPSLWHRDTDRPDPAGEPVADAVREDDLAADIPDPDEGAPPAEVVAIRRSAGRRGSNVEALRRREPDGAPSPAVPWSETGMSQALRDAIASVRRVSHGEMPERPLARANQVRYTPRQFDGDPAVGYGSFDVAETDARLSFDDQEARDEFQFDQPTAAERFDDQALYEESPPAGPHRGPQQASEEAAAVEEWPARAADWAGEQAFLAEDAPHEDLQFGDEQDAPLPSGRARRGRSWSGVRAARTAPFYEDEADEDPLSDDGWDEDSPPGLQEAARDRPPLWRGVNERPRSHLAALVLAPLFVLVAALGLGILSGAQGFDRVLTTLGWTSLADGSIEATPTPPAQPAASADRSPTSVAEPPPAASMPSSAGVAASPAAPAAPQLSELETVRVAPLPASPRTETTDPARSDMPLPPPPKPAPWSSLSREASEAGDRIETAIDAAAVALLTADGRVNNAVQDAAAAVREAAGAGGPFEPILVKSSASEPRIFVHYTEGAPDSPTTAMHLIRQLQAAGFKVEERPVQISIAENSIRYFFPGDRDEAEVLSAQLQNQVPGGAAVPIVDLTSYEPKPRRGHLEVWLGG